MIVVDFIDMDSRRDQLQLLEHFMMAMRDDTARPQIAQLTELGLVEMTRKRQGQNIYELFGRVSPGYEAVLPGKDLPQPQAAATGLVRSATSARAEVVAPADSGGGRRRRGGRGRVNGSTENKVVDPSLEATVAGESTSDATEPAGANRRQDPELVAVPMDDDQERVFGWLGLNPVLLLDPLPESDNLLVRVVRPGEDAESVLEDARQQLAASSGRRRRRGSRGGRGGARNGSSSPAPSPVHAAEPIEDSPLLVEITPLEANPVNDVQTSSQTVSRSASQPPEPAEAVVAEPEKPAEEARPGRRRRRSSATAE